MHEPDLVGDLSEEQTEEDYPKDKPSRWKKFLTLGIGAFMIVLMLSYIWMGYGLDQIIYSLIESEHMEGNIIKINDDSDLVFKERSYQTLLDNYLENQDKEFKACLLGKLNSNDYEITDVVIPEMLEQSFNRVVSRKCPEGTIVELHSHPYRRCIESGQDILSKELANRADSGILSAIMCEKGRFNFY